MVSTINLPEMLTEWESNVLSNKLDLFCRFIAVGLYNCLPTFDPALSELNLKRMLQSLARRKARIATTVQSLALKDGKVLFCWGMVQLAMAKLANRSEAAG